MAGNLLKASHVYIREKVPGYAWSFGISDLYMLTLDRTKEDVFFFYFQQRKFCFDKKIDNFCRLKPKLTSTTTKEVLESKYET